MFKKYLNTKNLYFIGFIFIFLLFLFISIRTPLEGDDWCYAVNGLENTPINKAFEFYHSWSGRFFSELWGFYMTNHKYLWNVINPLLFSSIYFFIYKLSGEKRNRVLAIIFLLTFVLSVNKDVRMETYTWIMGTTYVVPLCFSLCYFYIFERVYLDKLNKKWLYCANVLIFIACLMMENISGSIVLGIFILIIYCYFNKKELLVPLILNLIVSLSAFLIMRLSPGSAFRLLRDHPEWSGYSIFKKIVTGYPSFIETTFINNNYMVGLFSIVLSLLVIFSKRKNNIFLKLINIIISLIGLFAAFSFLFLDFDNRFMDVNSLFSKLFWIIYIINAFIEIFFYMDNGYNKNKALFFLIFGGSSALAMLLSPLYGARSSIYTIYYVALVSLIIITEMELKRIINVILTIVLFFIVIDKTNNYIEKYELINEYNKLRSKEITYYKSHPEEEYAGFMRYPIDTLHAVDIEWDDMVHLQAFADYYDLSQAYDKVYFYYGN